ncbi:hypothetical protein BS78_08G031600 [Paspalum vaginatum]|nr:hypothetical protein BS78_08G031600 [Paspalum vaginatum]
MSRAAEHNSALAATQDETEQMRAEATRLEGLRVAAVRQSSALSMCLDSASIESVLLCSKVGDLRREVERLRCERDAADESARELRAELQALRDAVGVACAWLTPPSLLPLSERLGALPGHVDRVVRQAAFFGSGMALAQAVSHFDELRPVLGPIAEGFAGGLGDEEVERVEAEVHPHAMTISSRIEPASLLLRAETE